MSLVARANMKKFKENQLLSFVESLQQTIGTEIHIECDLDQFNKSDKHARVDFFEMDFYERAFDYRFFGPILEVFKDMCKEPDFKEHIIAHIKKIVLYPLQDHDEIYGFVSVEDSVLTVRSLIYANIGDVGFDQRLKDMIFQAINRSADN